MMHAIIFTEKGYLIAEFLNIKLLKPLLLNYDFSCCISLVN